MIGDLDLSLVTCCTYNCSYDSWPKSLGLRIEMKHTAYGTLPIILDSVLLRSPIL
jgi:hypothetical protein